MAKLSKIFLVETEDRFQLVNDGVRVLDNDRLRVVITVRSGRIRYRDVVEGDQISEHGVLMGSGRCSESVEGVGMAGKASGIGLEDASVRVESDDGPDWESRITQGVIPEISVRAHVISFEFVEALFEIVEALVDIVKALVDIVKASLHVGR